jgi:probable O-glycosylation ligase (exosortase A-associated)
MLRDIAVLAIYGSLLGLTLTRPFIGVITWYVVSIGSLHKLSYGFSSDLPWAYVTMAVTVVGWIISRKKETKFVATPPILMLIAWGLWVQITTAFALNFAQGEPIWIKFNKIWISTLFMSMFLTSRERILAIVSVLAGCIGFYGAKGALHFLLSGSLRVDGPPASSLADNNDFGLGCVMMLPLLWYLRTAVPERWQKNAVLVVFGLTLIATFSTDSRGALVGLIIEFLVFWWKSRQKIRIVAATAVLGAVVYIALPQAYLDRMKTIGTYQNDASAESRLYNWQYAIKVATARPFLGGGMGTFRRDTFQDFGVTIHNALEAHSIYFQALGDQGYPGLLLFLLMWTVTYTSARWIRHRTRGSPDLRWAYDLSFYMQISLVAYAASGAFLSQAYLDLYYALIATTGMTRYVVREALARAAQPGLVVRGGPAPTAMGALPVNAR